MTYLTRAVLAAVAGGALSSAAHGGIMLGENLLTNYDAEAGPGGSGQVVPVPGWSVTSGLFTVAAYGGGPALLDAGDPGPANRADNYFTGGEASTSVAEQRYNLFPLQGAVDAGSLSFELSGWLGSAPGELDGATLSVTFLDAALDEIDTFSIGDAVRGIAPSGLTYEEMMDVVPFGAREAVVELTFTRSAAAGTSYNDGAADELSFLIIPAPGPTALFGLAGALAVRRRR